MLKHIRCLPKHRADFSRCDYAVELASGLTSGPQHTQPRADTTVPRSPDHKLQNPVTPVSSRLCPIPPPWLRPPLNPKRPHLRQWRN